MEFSAPWYLIVELGMLSVPSMKIGNAAASSNTTWPPWQAYVMAAICLLIGLAVGYLVRGSVPAAPSAAVSGRPSPNSAPQQMPTLQDMKRMADKQVEPLLEKLKAEPNNSDLLNQVGTIYRMTHQFETAATYYQEALQINPENVGARTDLASCVYYQGDVDGAIAQLEKSLTYDPRHAGTLLNLGIIRWQGKSDAAGALGAWKKLLKYNPDYPNMQTVEKFISDAKARSGKPLPLTD
jgi:cytochrome c-type biogenesis protein CcmH/NrfG